MWNILEGVTDIIMPSIGSPVGDLIVGLLLIILPMAGTLLVVLTSWLQTLLENKEIRQELDKFQQNQQYWSEIKENDYGQNINCRRHAG